MQGFTRTAAARTVRERCESFFGQHGLWVLLIAILAVLIYQADSAAAWLGTNFALLPAAFDFSEDEEIVSHETFSAFFTMMGFVFFGSIGITALLYSKLNWQQPLLERVAGSHLAKAAVKVLFLQSLSPSFVTGTTLFIMSFVFEWANATMEVKYTYHALFNALGNGDFAEASDQLGGVWEKLVVLCLFVTAALALYGINIKLLHSSRFTKWAAFAAVLFVNGMSRVHYSFGAIAPQHYFSPVLIQLYIPYFIPLVALGSIDIVPIIIVAWALRKIFAPPTLGDEETVAVRAMLCRMTGQLLTQALAVRFCVHASNNVARELEPHIASVQTLSWIQVRMFDVVLISVLVGLCYLYRRLVKWLYVSSPIFRIDWQRPRDICFAKCEGSQDDIVDRLTRMISGVAEAFATNRPSFQLLTDLGLMIHSLTTLNDQVIEYSCTFNVPVNNRTGPYFKMTPLRLEIRSLLRDPIGRQKFAPSFRDGPLIAEITSERDVEVLAGKTDPVEIFLRVRIFGQSLPGLLRRLADLPFVRQWSRRLLPVGVLSYFVSETEPLADGFRVDLKFDMGPLIPSYALPLIRCHGLTFVPLDASPVTGRATNVRCAAAVLENVHMDELKRFTESISNMPTDGSVPTPSERELVAAVQNLKDQMTKVCTPPERGVNANPELDIVAAVAMVLDVWQKAKKAQKTTTTDPELYVVLYRCSTALFICIWRLMLAQAMSRQRRDWVILVPAAFSIITTVAVQWSTWRQIADAADRRARGEKARRTLFALAEGNDEDPQDPTQVIDLGDPDLTLGGYDPNAGYDLSELLGEITDSDDEAKDPHDTDHSPATPLDRLSDSDDEVLRPTKPKGTGSSVVGPAATHGVAARGHAGGVSAAPSSDDISHRPGFKEAKKLMTSGKITRFPPPLMAQKLGAIGVPDDKFDECREALQAWSGDPENLTIIEPLLHLFAGSSGEEVGAGATGAGRPSMAAILSGGGRGGGNGRALPGLDLSGIGKVVLRSGGGGGGGVDGGSVQDDGDEADGFLAEMQSRASKQVSALLSENHDPIMEWIDRVNAFQLDTSATEPSLDEISSHYSALSALGLATDLGNWAGRLEFKDSPFTKEERRTAGQAYTRIMSFDPVLSAAFKAKTAVLDSLQYRGLQDEPGLELDVAGVKSRLTTLLSLAGLLNVPRGGGVGSASSAGAGAGAGAGSRGRGSGPAEEPVDLGPIPQPERDAVANYLHGLRDRILGLVPCLPGSVLATAQRNILSVEKQLEVIKPVTRQVVRRQAQKMQPNVKKLTTFVRTLLQGRYKSDAITSVWWASDAQRADWLATCDECERRAELLTRTVLDATATS